MMKFVYSFLNNQLKNIIMAAIFNHLEKVQIIKGLIPFYNKIGY